MKQNLLTKGRLQNFCDEFLRVRDVPDPWCKNGMQVPGKEYVRKIALGTSASVNFLRQAADWGADAVIVHHGLFWKKGITALSINLKERLRILLEKNISLYAYHLPLDAHPQIGNNAQIAIKLGLRSFEMQDICAIGEFAKPVSFSAFRESCEQIFGQRVHFGSDFKKTDVKRVGICSGGGGDYAEICFNSGADTFLTGEISEHHFHHFAELPINFVACGHYATERFGIGELGETLKQNFPEVTFSYFFEPCPV